MRGRRTSGSETAASPSAAMLGVATLVACTLLVSACSASDTGGGSDNTPAARVTVTGGGSSSSSSTPAVPAKPKKKVHIMLLNADGSVFGVGMPEIAYFSRKIKSGAALQKATTVTVDGKPAKGAWYFERSAAHKGYPVEGHFRLEHYWPANSKIFIKIPAKGLSAGGNMAFDDSLTSSWRTGASHIATVDDSSHTLTLTVNGKKEGTYPVSLGASNTPTRRGTKVIMEKGLSICMSGPGYDECDIKYTQRLTYDGEYLHSAPWNCTGSSGCTGPQNNIGSADSSNGCTNLLPDDAEKLYGLLRIGDVVTYPNANGPAMELGNGYGDWNVSWSSWLGGGYAPTS